MKFALIGEKLPHSYSKGIHEAFGLNYTLNEVEKGGVERFFKENDYDGFNVTIPYKIEVIKYIDKLSETAARVGSVNTVKRVDELFLVLDSCSNKKPCNLIEDSNQTNRTISVVTKKKNKSFFLYQKR